MAVLSALLLFSSRCGSTSLHFSQSSDRPLAYYRAPAPYQEAGKARLNSVIITSRPFSIGEEHNLTSRSNADAITTPEPQWRRQHFFTSTSTTTTRPRLTTQIPHYSIDCANGKSCSETININSTPNPTFKPYSQEELEKFINDYAASKQNSGKHHASNDTNTHVVKISSSRNNNKNYHDNKNKELAEVEPAVEPTNRLASLHLDEDDDPDAVTIDGKSRPHWSLIQAQHHNHPYDDREGWVTLEAIPWSTSKISKWQSHNSGNKRPQWTTFPKPLNNYDTRPPNQDWPSKPWDRPQYNDRPNDWKHEKPIKPLYLIGNRPVDENWSQDTTHKPLIHLERPVGDYDYKPVGDYDYNKPSQGHNQQWINSNSPDIITDGAPENWPISNRPGSPGGPGGPGSFKPWSQSEGDYSHHQDHYDEDYKHEPNRRPPTSVTYHDGGKPHTHPDSGEGEWVLLSSTKGYSLPIRHHSYQRAITFNPKPISSTRAVKLTVLPALNGTANMTTSHGGLLEVESTFQSVEDAQRDEAFKRLEANDTKVAQPVRLVSRPISKRGSGRAVLAAVGAGMLPATMALLVPMMLGRKKRSTVQPIANFTTAMPTVQQYNLPRLNSRKEDGKRWKVKKRIVRRKKVVHKVQQ